MIAAQTQCRTAFSNFLQLRNSPRSTGLLIRVRTRCFSNSIHTLSPHLAGSRPVRKPYYITTPIFYPNAAPHIGHLYSLVVADIFARHAKLTQPKRAVKLITGTDEHGMKIQKAAKERGMKPQELCDVLGVAFHDLAQRANVRFTNFVRTTTDDHRRAVQVLWEELNRRGYIYKGKHSGWYSVSDECFYTDAQVRKQTSLQTGEGVKVAIETGNMVEWTEEENYKFKLSALKKRLLEHFTTNPDAIYPPHQHLAVVASLESATRDPSVLPELSVSRPSSRLSWGIPVPGDASQTMYVWLDALSSYLTGIGYPWADSHEARAAGWPVDLQIIGKDILRFHAIYFPAFLMALDIPLPRTLLSHAHWTVNKAKMSKSVGNVVDPIAEIKERGVDSVRWYLARVGGRFKDDVDWSEEQLVKHEAELRSLLGNLFLRMQSSKILERVPQGFKTIPLHRDILLGRRAELRGGADMGFDAPGSEAYDDQAEDRIFLKGDHEALEALGEDGVDYAKEHEDVVESDNALELVQESIQMEESVVDRELRSSLGRLRGKFAWHMQRHEVGDAVQAIVDVLNLANKEFTRIAPWAPGTPSWAVVQLLTWSRETLRITGILLQPFIPSTAQALLDALHVHSSYRTYQYAAIGSGRVNPGPLLRAVLVPTAEQRAEMEVESDFAEDKKAEIRAAERRKAAKQIKTLHPKRLPRKLNAHYKRFPCLYPPKATPPPEVEKIPSTPLEPAKIDRTYVRKAERLARKEADRLKRENRRAAARELRAFHKL